jgi:hypothetical protein
VSDATDNYGPGLDLDWEERKASDRSLVDDLYTGFMGLVEEANAGYARTLNGPTAEERERMQREMMQFKIAFVRALEENLASQGIGVLRLGLRGFDSESPFFHIELGDRAGRTFHVTLSLDEANEMLALNGPSGGQKILELTIRRVLAARAARAACEAMYSVRGVS